MTVSEIKDMYSMRDILERCGVQKPNKAGFIKCPFHTGDRQPSMKIYDKDYNCFACGANGDIFTFMQELYEISFKEAFLELGGTYENDDRRSRFYRQKLMAERKRQHAINIEKEKEFRAWRKERLGQVCNTLQFCDMAIPKVEPYSDEWVFLIDLRSKNEYKYYVLGFGDREAQEEMRRLDE